MDITEVQICQKLAAAFYLHEQTEGEIYVANRNWQKLNVCL